MSPNRYQWHVSDLTRLDPIPINDTGSNEADVGSSLVGSE